MQIVSILETVCLKYLILFSRKNKKNVSQCRLLNFSSSMLSLHSNICFTCLLLGKEAGPFILFIKTISTALPEQTADSKFIIFFLFFPENRI